MPTNNPGNRVSSSSSLLYTFMDSIIIWLSPGVPCRQSWFPDKMNRSSAKVVGRRLPNSGEIASAAIPPITSPFSRNQCILLPRAEAQMSRCYYSFLRRCHTFVFSFYGDRGQCASYFSGRTIFGRQLATGVPSLITWLHANALHCKYRAMPMPTLIFTASAMGALWLVEGSNHPATLTKIIVFSFTECRYLVYREGQLGRESN